METIHADVLNAIETNWSTFGGTLQSIVEHLLANFETTVAPLADAVGVTTQTVRANLKKLEDLEIVERLSEKTRDKDTIYRFKNK